jgi:riboflavin biosynthesis pyrimidine reductase
LVKLKKLFGIDKIVLQGGPIIDGAFISDDLIDTIIIIICPCTAAGDETIFKPSKYV